ncbi:cysteine proteinase inhibitor [Trifolium repens]|nr:cysteine proteinase inhibitor [Trifolium repens]
MRFQSLVICIVLFALVAKNEAQSRPINVTAPYVIEIANFAVTEYNKQIFTTTKLKFEEVINGESRILKIGMIFYHLTLAANNGSASNNYTTKVWDRPLDHSRGLLSFEIDG